MRSTWCEAWPSDGESTGEEVHYLEGEQGAPDCAKLSAPTVWFTSMRARKVRSASKVRAENFASRMGDIDLQARRKMNRAPPERFEGEMDAEGGIGQDCWER